MRPLIRKDADDPPCLVMWASGTLDVPLGCLGAVMVFRMKGGPSGAKCGGADKLPHEACDVRDRANSLMRSIM